MYRWLKVDAAFRAAYSAWPQEVLSSAQSRLLEALDDAVITIRESVADGNVDLAMKLVHGFAALRRPELDVAEAIQITRQVTAEELRGEAKPQPIESAATAPGDAAATVSIKSVGS